jgi:hypothetical protein
MSDCGREGCFRGGRWQISLEFVEAVNEARDNQSKVHASQCNAHAPKASEIHGFRHVPTLACTDDRVYVPAA